MERRGAPALVIPPARLADYVTERGNPGNTKSVEQVVIDHPSAWLARGVRLVDTPGIGSVHAHGTEATRRYLPQADAVLFVASVDQPMSRAELDFLREVRAHAGKIFVVLNKTDHLGPDELRESLAFSSQVVSEALGVAVPVFPVSARRALEARQSGEMTEAGSGLAGLQQALRHFVDRDKTDTWLEGIGRSLRRLLSQARLALDLEAQVLTAPLERIEAEGAVFRQEKARFERARTDYQVLLEADARRLLAEHIEPDLEAFKQSQQAQAPSLIERWTGEMSDLPPRALATQLEQRLTAHVRSAYDGWLAGLDSETSRAFEGLCARFWDSLGASADERMRRSSERFGLPFAPVRSESGWHLDSGFYYKFWHEPTTLGALASSALLALPRRVAVPIIVRRTQTRALDLIEMQAGRIRHDLEERMKQSVRDASRQMTSQIEAGIQAMEQALQEGIRLRHSSEDQARARGAELERLRGTIDSLEARLAAVAGEEPT